MHDCHLGPKGVIAFAPLPIFGHGKYNPHRVQLQKSVPQELTLLRFESYFYDSSLMLDLK